MRKVSIKAFILGNIGNLILENLPAFFFGYYFSGQLRHDGVPKENIHFLLQKALQDNATLHHTLFIVGVISNILMGYISARIAKRHEILNASLASAFGVLSRLFMKVTAHTLGLGSISILLIPIIAAFGGYIRLFQLNGTAVQER